MEVSIRLMSAVFESETLGPTERLIMLALADHADDEGRCYPSTPRLCQRTGLGERAVQTNLKRLQAQGYISIIPNGGPKGVNLFFIRATPAADAPPQQMRPRTKRDPAANAATPRSKCAVPPQQMRPEPSGTIIEPSEEKEEEGARAVVADLSLLSRLTHALGFDHHGIVPKYWASPDAVLIVARWQTDLGLTPDEILHVATGNAKAHGSPANGPKTLTRHMQGYAAAKNAPRLEPTKGTAHDLPSSPRSPLPGRSAAAAGQQFTGLAGAAMRARLAREQGH